MFKELLRMQTNESNNICLRALEIINYVIAVIILIGGLIFSIIATNNELLTDEKDFLIFIPTTVLLCFIHIVFSRCTLYLLINVERIARNSNNQ